MLDMILKRNYITQQEFTQVTEITYGNNEHQYPREPLLHCPYIAKRTLLPIDIV